MKRDEIVVDASKLADLDEARDYDAASSYNYLNAELHRLRSALDFGTVVRINTDSDSLSFESVAEFVTWARGRYPHADHS